MFCLSSYCADHISCWWILRRSVMSLCTGHAGAFDDGHVTLQMSCHFAHVMLVLAIVYYWSCRLWLANERILKEPFWAGNVLYFELFCKHNTLHHTCTPKRRSELAMCCVFFCVHCTIRANQNQGQSWQCTLYSFVYIEPYVQTKTTVRAGMHFLLSYLQYSTRAYQILYLGEDKQWLLTAGPSWLLS